MGGSYLTSPAVFLIDTLASLYIFAVMLRFLLQWVEADFYNPISQFLVKITHPLLRPMRRFIPSVGRVDTASLLLMLTVQSLDMFLVASLQQVALSPVGLVLAAFGQLLELLFNIYFYAILISAVMSWVPMPHGYNPAVKMLYELTEPLLSLFRRLLPPMGGIDLSPLMVLVGLQFTKMVVLPPLHQLIAMVG